MITIKTETVADGYISGEKIIELDGPNVSELPKSYYLNTYPSVYMYENDLIVNGSDAEYRLSIGDIIEEEDIRCIISMCDEAARRLVNILNNVSKMSSMNKKIKTYTFPSSNFSDYIKRLRRS